MKRAIPMVILLAAMFVIWSLQEMSGRTGIRRDRYNVILISVDGLRADHLGLYGHTRDTTSKLEEILRLAPGVRFADAQSPSPDPFVGHVSLLTSLSPLAHLTAVTPEGGLGTEIWTLAEELQVYGYQTAAFVDGGILDGDRGIERGFESFTVVPRADVNGPKGTDKLRRKVYEANRFLAGLGDDQPFFLFFHSALPVPPFYPPYPFSVRFDPDYPEFTERHVSLEHIEKIRTGRERLDPALLRHVIAQYDGEVATVDSVLADWLYRLFMNADYLKNTVVVFLSTHGAELYDHGTLGPHAPEVLLDTSLRVPLIFWIPGWDRSRVVESQVRLIDVMPTLWDLLGLPESRPMEGTSLVSRMLGKDSSPLPAYSEAAVRTYDLRSMRIPPYRLVVDPGLGENLLFDVIRDPRNTMNLIGEHPEEAERLEKDLDEYVRSIEERGRRLSR